MRGYIGQIIHYADEHWRDSYFNGKDSVSISMKVFSTHDEAEDFCIKQTIEKLKSRAAIYDFNFLQFLREVYNGDNKHLLEKFSKDQLENCHWVDLLDLLDWDTIKDDIYRNSDFDIFFQGGLYVQRIFEANVLAFDDFDSWVY